LRRCTVCETAFARFAVSNAMRELRRVLRPTGRAVVQVPVLRKDTIEDPGECNPAERLRRFGQDDHVRVYGSDFPDRLEDAGLPPPVIHMRPELSRWTRWRCGLDYKHRDVQALPSACHVYPQSPLVVTMYVLQGRMTAATRLPRRLRTVQMVALWFAFVLVPGCAGVGLVSQFPVCLG